MNTPRTALEELELLKALMFNAQHTPNEFNQRAYEIAAGKLFWNHGKALSEALGALERIASRADKGRHEEDFEAIADIAREALAPPTSAKESEPNQRGDE